MTFWLVLVWSSLVSGKEKEEKSSSTAMDDHSLYTPLSELKPSRPSRSSLRMAEICPYESRLGEYAGSVS